MHVNVYIKMDIFLLLQSMLFLSKQINNLITKLFTITSHTVILGISPPIFIKAKI